MLDLIIANQDHLINNLAVVRSQINMRQYLDKNKCTQKYFSNNFRRADLEKL